MTTKRIFLFLSIACFLLLSFVKTQTLTTGDDSNMDGIQVYFLNSNSAYLFGTFNGSATSITVTLYLFLSDTKTRLDSSNGCWAGVGFGSNDMYSSDMVICQYFNNNFSCLDYWSDSNSLPSLDTSLGGKNDVSNVSGTITTISVNSYNTLLTFTFTKDISNLDKYDWSAFAKWQTNTGSMSGAYGFNSDSKTTIEHPSTSKRNSMADGNGFRSGITVNTSTTPTATTTPTTTPTVTTTPTTTTTTTPSTTTSTTTPSTTATTTTQKTTKTNSDFSLNSFCLGLITILIMFIF